MVPRKFARSRATTVANSQRAGARTSSWRFAALLLTGLLVAAPVAEATVLRGLTAGQLRSRADVIIQGKVVELRTMRTEGRIETVAIVRVRQVHKGEVGRRIEVLALGGEIRDRRMVVQGAASFARGDTVLLFLYSDGGSWRPVGMFQGVWHLDSEGVVARASDSGGASLLRPAKGNPAVDQEEQLVARLIGRGGAR